MPRPPRHESGAAQPVTIALSPAAQEELDRRCEDGRTRGQVIEALLIGSRSLVQDQAAPMVTKSGKVLTDEDVQALADEAELPPTPELIEKIKKGVAQAKEGKVTPFEPGCQHSKTYRGKVAGTSVCTSCGAVQGKDKVWR